MSWIGETLWDLMRVGRGRALQKEKVRLANVKSRGRGGEKPQAAIAEVKPARTSMQQRYDALVEQMKRKYGVRVRKWRNSSSGVAWTVRYTDGRIVKLIESPYPRGPMSCAIFMHEIGHHAIGLGVYKPRCLEEYRVWLWALEQMRLRGFNVTPAVEKRVEQSMRYAVGKAKRRGLQSLPEELARYS